MKTEPADGAHEPGNNRKQRNHVGKPKRVGTTGPIGFGSVMKDVKGDAGGGKKGKGAGTTAADLAQFGTQLDMGAQAAASMGAVRSTEQALQQDASGVRSATDALADQDQSLTHTLQQQDVIPTQLGRMTPSRVLNVVVDEATKQAIDLAARELHVELEPEDLGPLLIKLTKQRDGRLEVRFTAKQADAARILDSGADLLREQLAGAGFANALVSVDQDADLTIDAGAYR
ncbi:MAG: Flagellar hook-length control protein FliK [Thermoleophilia bacterium]|nr:Flagellar hook-length control protein FliK [Thermoleophilia bacterium]